MPDFETTAHKVNTPQYYDLKLVGARVDVAQSDGRYHKALTIGHVFQDLHATPDRSFDWVIESRFIWVNDNENPTRFVAKLHPFESTRIYLYYIRSNP